MARATWEAEADAGAGLAVSYQRLFQSLPSSAFASATDCPLGAAAAHSILGTERSGARSGKFCASPLTRPRNG